MRYFVLLTAILLGFAANAQEWEDQKIFKGTGSTKPLRILSSTDTSFFAPVIQGYQAINPEVNIEYLVTSTANLDELFRKSPENFDIVVSSAMDLQLKLVNDGYGAKIDGIDHPSWAQWRQSLFAFTIEPAAIVINKAAFKGRDIPKTRHDLIQELRSRPQFFEGKLGTYDVRQSGLGYLFATQDARASETYWRLMEVMGRIGTNLYCCSGDMIDDLTSGKIAVAYNVLGSYADARAQKDGQIEVILPADFPTTMMRTALVSKDAPNGVGAAGFMQHLLRTQSSNPEDRDGRLPPLMLAPGQQTITIEPALMTYLDRLKRQTFIKEWERAIIQ
jgi:iron(III) transport system substrate-binding protein